LTSFKIYNSIYCGNDKYLTISWIAPGLLTSKGRNKPIFSDRAFSARVVQFV